MSVKNAGWPDAYDNGIEDLAELKNLKFLNLRNTEMTRAGVEKLRPKLPKCEIDSSLDSHRRFCN
jgi:hypothetical protein